MLFSECSSTNYKMISNDRNKRFVHLIQNKFALKAALSSCVFLFLQLMPVHKPDTFNFRFIIGVLLRCQSTHWLPWGSHIQPDQGHNMLQGRHISTQNSSCRKTDKLRINCHRLNCGLYLIVIDKAGN